MIPELALLPRLSAAGHLWRRLCPFPPDLAVRVGCEVLGAPWTQLRSSVCLRGFCPGPRLPLSFWTAGSEADVFHFEDVHLVVCVLLLRVLWCHAGEISDGVGMGYGPLLGLLASVRCKC